MMKPTLAALLAVPLTAMLVAAGTAHADNPDLQRTGQDLILRREFHVLGWHNRVACSLANIIADSRTEMGMAEPRIVDEVLEYLERSGDRFTRGSDEYYARKCLEAALTAYRLKNYGIGAVAVVYEEKTAREWSAGNCMVSGNGVIDHAETRALLRIANGEVPDATYQLESAPPHGLSVFGTLEPCPMCACVMTNAGATRSVSTVEDGHLIQNSGFFLSDGAANVLGAKSKTQPAIWQSIQQGRALKFEQLSTTDAALQSLSRRIFEETRTTIDQDLSDRTHLGHATAVRNLYRARFQ